MSDREVTEGTLVMDRPRGDVMRFDSWALLDRDGRIILVCDSERPTAMFAEFEVDGRRVHGLVAVTAILPEGDPRGHSLAGMSGSRVALLAWRICEALPVGAQVRRIMGSTYDDSGRRSSEAVDVGVLTAPGRRWASPGRVCALAEVISVTDALHVRALKPMPVPDPAPEPGSWVLVHFIADFLSEMPVGVDLLEDDAWPG